MIVYSESLAKSARGKSLTPFAKNSKNKSYNIVYGYFLEICSRFGLKAAFTTSADIVGPGKCQSYWTFKNKKWQKVGLECFSTLIFDKFSPKRKGVKSRRELLFSTAEIKPFNDPKLFKMFFDKQKTYDNLAKYAIPTISIDTGTQKTIEDACRELTKMVGKHPEAKDFGQEIIMKDRFGAGGRHVYKFEQDKPEDMWRKAQRNTRLSYIIQPFAKFDQGFSYQKCPASTDIRLIYLKGKIVQSYIRMAKSGEFRCNEHQGGLLTYLPMGGIPKMIVEKSNTIAKILNNKCSLFTLDFIISNRGNAYLLEGNTGPGLDWNTSIKRNEIEAKKLIRMVVGELAQRCG